MDDLIEALQIFRKYANPTYPTHCEHDTLYVVGMPNPENMDKSDAIRLEKLGFIYSNGENHWISFKFGSA